VFMDSIVCKLRLAGDGASIGRHYLGCILYADDIMPVCSSITAFIHSHAEDAGHLLS